MEIIISNTSDQPLYKQVKDQVKSAILGGQLKEGDALPSIRSFANDLGVSVLTIRRAYDDLENEGFVVSFAGRGTFVAAASLDLLQDAKRREVESLLLAAIQAAKELNIERSELEAMMAILYEEEEE